LSLNEFDAPRRLAAQSRSLLALAFSFAVLWKAVLAPDFLDGRFFRVTLMTDPRFGEAVMLMGGLSADDLATNRKALEPLPHGAELLTPTPVIEPPRVRAIASVSTWGVLALEALVAAFMILPAGRLHPNLRHAVLLTFCLVTYAFAPVAGFG
jgi:hypothetical protein